MNAAHHAHRVAQGARQGARSGLGEALARFGYVMRGVIYVTMGALVLEIALGARREAADPLGALQAIARQPFGRLELVLVAAGLSAFALWRFVQAVTDSDNLGRSKSAIAKRIVLGMTGILYAPLAIAAVRLLVGEGPAARRGDHVRPGLLLAWKWGPLVVAGVALVLLIIALVEMVVAFRAAFLEEMNVAPLSTAARRLVVTIGRIGFVAHASIFAVVAYSLTRAAFLAEPRKTRGIDGALAQLAHHGDGHGRALVAAIGAGLVVFGIFSFVMARYRRRAAGAS